MIVCLFLRYELISIIDQMKNEYELSIMYHHTGPLYKAFIPPKLHSPTYGLSQPVFDKII